MGSGTNGIGTEGMFHYTMLIATYQSSRQWRLVVFWPEQNDHYVLTQLFIVVIYAMNMVEGQFTCSHCEDKVSGFITLQKHFKRKH